jgi:hypothetical protein
MRAAQQAEEDSHPAVLAILAVDLHCQLQKKRSI